MRVLGCFARHAYICTLHAAHRRVNSYSIAPTSLHARGLIHVLATHVYAHRIHAHQCIDLHACQSPSILDVSCTYLYSLHTRVSSFTPSRSTRVPLPPSPGTPVCAQPPAPLAPPPLSATKVYAMAAAPMVYAMAAAPTVQADRPAGGAELSSPAAHPAARQRSQFAPTLSAPSAAPTTRSCLRPATRCSTPASPRRSPPVPAQTACRHEAPPVRRCGYRGIHCRFIHIHIHSDTPITRDSACSFCPHVRADPVSLSHLCGQGGGR